MANQSRYLLPSNLLGVFALLALSSSVLLGCGAGGLEGTIPVRGKVTFDGHPLAKGEVRYMPVEAEGRVARGRLDSSGGFALTTLKEGDGALPGEYRIVVIVFPEEAQDAAIQRKKNQTAGAKSDPSAPPIPARYYSSETSGLTDKVDSNHSGYKEFQLVP